MGGVGGYMANTKGDGFTTTENTPRKQEPSPFSPHGLWLAYKLMKELEDNERKREAMDNSRSI